MQLHDIAIHHDIMATVRRARKPDHGA
jgi:hypothetical protein